jgi:uncharacterized membrane protein YfcA
VFALGIVLSVAIGVTLGFFGGGGSILTVPLLVYVFALPPKQAIATSLLVVAAASASGLATHWRLGTVRWRTGLVFGAAGMAGAYLGGRAGAFVDGALLLVLFAAMMLLTSVAMWRGRRPPAAGAGAEHSTPRLLAQGFAVGSFTGLVGAGGGFLIVPALALWAGLPMPAAVGTSLFVIVLNALAGFTGYASHVRVSFALVGAVAGAAIAGSFIGARLALRVAPGSLRRAFAGFVLAMGVFILVRESGTWLAAAQASLPASVAQLVFALAMLGLGLAAGRASRRGGAEPLGESAYEQGAGI